MKTREPDLWNFKKYADLPAVLTEDGKEYRYSEIDMLRQELASRIRPHTLVLLLADNDCFSPFLLGFLMGLPSHLCRGNHKRQLWRIGFLGI